MSQNHIVSKNEAVKSSLWKILESFGSKGVSMLVSIVLARLLMPEVYGVIALTSVFINLTDILIQAGFATTLIRKETATDEDYSTVLCISIASSFVLYCIIFLASPWIAEMYKTPQLSPVLRVIALTLFCQAFASVRTAVVARTMRFRTLFVCTMIANIISGIIGIVLAMLDFGVWALVFQQLSQQGILTILLLASVKIKYTFRISKESVKEIVPPSLKILSSSLLSFAGDSMYSIVIGKVYSMEELGYTEKGSLFPRSFSLYTFSAVSNVFLPVFSSFQKDYDRLNSIFRRVVNVSSYVIFPMMAGLCMVAEPLIAVILTEQWLPAVGIMRWNCLYYAVTPLMLANVQLHFAIGKNNIRIKTEIIRIAMLALGLMIFVIKKAPINTVAMVVAFIQVLIMCILMFETKKATGYRLKDTLKDLFPTAISTGIMCVVVFFVLRFPFSYVQSLVIGIVVGTVVYLGSSILLRNRAFYELFDMAKMLINRRKGKTGND